MCRRRAQRAWRIARRTKRMVQSAEEAAEYRCTSLCAMLSAPCILLRNGND